MEIQKELCNAHLPQADGYRLKLKLSADATVLAVLCYHITSTDESVAKVELVMLARHVSCHGMGLGEDVMGHFWTSLRSELQGTPTPREVQVSAIVRPDNKPSKSLMSAHGLSMLVGEDAEGWETWGVTLPWQPAPGDVEVSEDKDSAEFTQPL